MISPNAATRSGFSGALTGVFNAISQEPDWCSSTRLFRLKSGLEFVGGRRILHEVVASTPMRTVRQSPKHHFTTAEPLHAGP